MSTYTRLCLLLLYENNKLEELQTEIEKLNYSELEFYCDVFNNMKEYELSQLLFNRKLIV